MYVMSVAIVRTPLMYLKKSNSGKKRQGKDEINSF